MPNFSSKTEAILTASGWYEGRRVDVFPYIHQLEKQGYTVFPVVREFFEQFGGLVLRKPNFLEPSNRSWLDLMLEFVRSRPKYPGRWFDLRLEQLEQALESYGATELEIFTEELNMVLCPIGHCSDSVFYAMDEAGKVYGLYRPTAMFVADSGELSIERYCTWTPENPYQVIHDYSQTPKNADEE